MEHAMKSFFLRGLFYKGLLIWLLPFAFITDAGSQNLPAVFSDSGRTQQMQKEGARVADKYPDSAIALYMQALSYSKTIGYADGYGISLQELSKLYVGRGLYDSCLHLLQQELHICNQYPLLKS